ncbi:DNA-3-methyladenine glycosylase I [Phyllobacterium sp. SB3]|uniref:DNA-3-methyladenine glycosylase I n=1 Tax=Phyllobacterium sp. SB3 TaxID=3156073 RepID=UPI0032AF4AE6
MGEDIPAKTGLIKGDDGITRCSWPGALPEYIHYHDHEWGRPVTDDTRLFEKVCLEGFQSGLSWLTILRKRENFREAFDGFDYRKIARYTDKDVERLLGNAGIIRHRGKINSAINNANRALELVKETGSIAAYFWSFEPPAEERPKTVDYATLIANPTSPTSVRLSKDLKKRGWSFVGPTTMYAHMQAMGLVNDHVEGCKCRQEIEATRASFKRPK